jgi:ABC-2 type transport system permease protein
MFLAFFYLWSSIYRQGGQVGNYNLQSIVLYYFAANFIALVIKGTDIAWIVGNEIRLGRISGILLQPISYSKYKFTQILGGYFFRGVMYFFIFSIAGIFLFPFLKFHIDFSRIIFFLSSMGLGSVIYFLLFYIIGLTAFWFGLVRGFRFGFSMVVIFLEGSLIPLDLLPSVINKINYFLPFKYIMFVPVSIFTGRTEVEIKLFLIPVLWIFLLYFLAKLVFKKGIKAYEGSGL